MLLLLLMLGLFRAPSLSPADRPAATPAGLGSSSCCFYYYSFCILGSRLLALALACVCGDDYDDAILSRQQKQDNINNNNEARARI